MRLKWSKHIMQCNPVLIERWRNKGEMFWRLVKIIPPLRNSESKASGNKCSSKDPDDQIWDSKTWLNENQVKLSCFSPVSVHLEILLTISKSLYKSVKMRGSLMFKYKWEHLSGYFFSSRSWSLLIWRLCFIAFTRSSLLKWPRWIPSLSTIKVSRRSTCETSVCDQHVQSRLVLWFYAQYI